MKNLNMLIGRFQERNRVRKNPEVILRRSNRYQILDLATKAMVLCAFIGCGLRVLALYVSQQNTSGALTATGLYFVAFIVIRMAIMTYAQGLMPQPADLLIALRWQMFRNGLRYVNLWEPLIGATSDEDLEQRVERYFRDLVSSIHESLDEGDLFMAVHLEHQHMHARAIAEGMLGISVQPLTRFQLDLGFETSFRPDPTPQSY